MSRDKQTAEVLRSIREKARDLWFAFRSDRRTLPCYRDIQDNRRFMEISREIEEQRGDP